MARVKGGIKKIEDEEKKRLAKASAEKKISLTKGTISDKEFEIFKKLISNR